jgi:hypothetical protein
LIYPTFFEKRALTLPGSLFMIEENPIGQKGGAL